MRSLFLLLALNLVWLAGASAETLKVLNLNVWGLRIPVMDIAQDIEARLARIPGAVADTGADVVTFSEVWSVADRTRLTAKMRELGYEYSFQSASIPASQYKPVAGHACLAALWALGTEVTARRGFVNRRTLLRRGVRGLGYTAAAVAFAAVGLETTMVARMGNGLMAFSKYPLSAQPDAQLVFSEHTRADEVYVAKGGLFLSVAVPGLGPVDLAIAHLGAVSYDAKEKAYDPVHSAIRLQQTKEFVEFVKRRRDLKRRPLIVSLDLNAHYQLREGGKLTDQLAPEYRLLVDAQNGLGLKDSYLTANPASIRNPAWTFDTKKNPYAGGGAFSEIPPEVIDYILVGGANPAGLTLVVTESKLVFTEPVDGFFLTDHFGLLSFFEIRKP